MLLPKVDLMTSDARTADLSSLRINRDMQPESSGSKRWLVIALAALVVGGAGGYALLGDTLFPHKEEVSVGVAVRSSPAQTDAVLTASGYVVAERQAAVSSKATGRLTALYIIEGDTVKQGQVIGRIESDDIEAQLVQLRAALAVSKADVDDVQAELADAKISLDRQLKLVSSGSTTQAALDAAQMRFKRAQAQLAARQAAVSVAEANIRMAQVQLENTVIRAPFNGTVLTKNANVGEVITSLGAAAGSRGAVATIADMGSLEVEADVSESNIERIVPDQPCEVSLDAYPDKRYRAYVHKIIPTADRAKATVQIKIRFAERDERVLPEMSAKVLFLKPNSEQTQADNTPRLMVPADAVVKRNNATTVFRVGDDGKVRAVSVVLGSLTNGFAEVKQGLADGDKIVRNPSETLRDGSSVEVLE